MASLQAIAYRTLFKFQIWRRSGGPPPTVQQARAFLDNAGERVKPAAGVNIEPTSVPNGANPINGEWYKPDHAAEGGAILYLHGGGYRTGSCKSHRGFVTHIAQAANLNTLLPEYRLAPENPFPAALDDARAAYNSLLAAGERPDQIAIVGDSAGGGLTLALLLSLRDENQPLPACAAVISPWTDLAGTGESMRTQAKKDPWLDPAGVHRVAKQYYGEASPTDPYVSPLYGRYTHIPPLLIQVGTHEILLDDATRLAHQAQTDGADVTLRVYRGMWHVWHAFIGRNIPECAQAITEIGDFIKAKMTTTQT